MNREVNNMIKRAIITLALTSAMLFSVSNIAKADITDPITKAQVKKHFELWAPFVYMAEACNTTNYIPLFKQVMNQGYEIAQVADEMDKSLVDMYWPALFQLSHTDIGGTPTPRFVKALQASKTEDAKQACGHVEKELTKYIK